MNNENKEEGKMISSEIHSFDINEVVAQEINGIMSGKVTSKGQVTIPIEVREVLNIQEGDRLKFTVKNGVLTFEVIKGVHPDELFGILKPRSDIKIKDFNEIRKITEEHYVDENWGKDK
jgi:antitoxin PrlF